MKLSVTDPQKNVKHHLQLVASTRSELAILIGSPWFNIDNRLYHVNEVSAETENNSTAIGAIVGGVIGLLAGPIGVLIGGTLGGALGNDSDKSESIKMQRFNSSTA